MAKKLPSLTQSQSDALVEEYLNNGGTISKFLPYGKVEIQKRNTETKKLEIVHSFETKEAYDNFREKETTHDLD